VIPGLSVEWARALALAPFVLLLYTYAAYPAILALLGRFRREDRAKREASGPGDGMTVSVVLSAYNEEEVISARIRNLLSLDYPADRLEILVGSDGSTDGTCRAVPSLHDRRVRLFAFKRRRGKAAVINDLVAASRGDVVLMTDANTDFEPGVARALVRELARHSEACAVVGRLDLISPAERGNLDGAYWKYETWVKRLESHFGCVLGANGAIYAFRRAEFEPLPRGVIVDDFLLPLLIRLRHGGGVYFVEEAVARETSPPSVADEFRRRIRIGAGDVQALRWTWRLLLPWRGTVAFAFLSHKVLRWAGPWLILAGFLGELRVVGEPAFLALLLGQAAVLLLALFGPPLRRLPVLGAAAAGARYFLVLNAALLVGSVRLTLGAARPFWGVAPRRA